MKIYPETSIPQTIRKNSTLHYINRNTLLQYVLETDKLTDYAEYFFTSIYKEPFEIVLLNTIQLFILYANMPIDCTFNEFLQNVA